MNFQTVLAAARAVISADNVGRLNVAREQLAAAVADYDALEVPSILWTGACPWCNASFRTRAELQEHQAEEHGDAP